MRISGLSVLLVGAAIVVAVSCGSDDDARKDPPGAGAGEAGAPNNESGMGSGAAPQGGGDGANAGAGATLPGNGGAGAPTAGAGLGGEGPTDFGGMGGDANAGQGGAAGASGAGGNGPEPPLFADDFNGEQLEVASLYSVNYVEFAQWDVASGSVDVTVLPNGFIDSPGGYGAGQLASGVVVDLNGSTLQNGTLQTKDALTFEPGVAYTLRYVLGNARNQTNAVTVTIAGLVSETRTQNSVTAFTAYQTSFTPVTQVTTKLVFASAGGGDDDGLLLDNVSLSH